LRKTVLGFGISIPKLVIISSKLQAPKKFFRELCYSEIKADGKSSTQQAPTAQPPVTRVTKIIGSNAACALRAAKELRKNRIFCVSNLSTDTSIDQILKYLTDNSIKVNSVFPAKTKFANSNGFRVNIDASDVDKFTSKDLWTSYIVVREWVFKGNKTTTNQQNG